ncbi:hypothetical protein [Sulfurimonas sp.]|uniref:hypothetical protein n=1 Tax=Sulfurimonas sp. TaxID=2022749 RepID=UPI0025DCB060|nr:hypothetical protein [Sulfurimonas sp.]MBW6487482.1 hypothetical protein [Sulfurimonas sp.]
MRYLKRRVSSLECSTSATVVAILAYIYRKENLLSQCGRYAQNVIDGLVDLGLIKKVISKKGIFYFKTEKAQNFKAIDFAKEYLWAFHNVSERLSKHGKKYILCFDSSLPNGKDLVEIEEAMKKNYI